MELIRTALINQEQVGSFPSTAFTIPNLSSLICNIILYRSSSIITVCTVKFINAGLGDN